MFFLWTSFKWLSFPGWGHQNLSTRPASLEEILISSELAWHNQIGFDFLHQLTGMHLFTSVFLISAELLLTNDCSTVRMSWFFYLLNRNSGVGQVIGTWLLQFCPWNVKFSQIKANFQSTIHSSVLMHHSGYMMPSPVLAPWSHCPSQHRTGIHLLSELGESRNCGALSGDSRFRLQGGDGENDGKR